jgi:hypothetical protein
LIRKPVITVLTSKLVLLEGEKQSSLSKLIFGQSGGLQTPPEDAAFPSQDLATAAKTRGESFQQKFVFMEILFPSGGSHSTDFSLLALAFRSHQIHSP